MKKFLIYVGIIIVFSGVSYSADGTITVKSPNGGERWKIGTTHNITWDASGVTGNVALTLHRGSVNAMPTAIIKASIPASLGTYRWTIPATDLRGRPLKPGSNYKVMVGRSASPFDLSNSNFTIMSQSSLPNVLQHKPLASTIQRAQTGPVKQRAPARTTRQQAKTNRIGKIGNASYPDLQITHIKIVPESPDSDTRPLQCRITIKNKGAKASNPCTLRLKVETNTGDQRYSSTRPLINLPAIAPGSEVQKSFEYYLFLSNGTPKEKISGWYKNTVTIDPARTSGENGITRMNNTKALPYRVTGFPRIAGCIYKFSLYRPVDVKIKNVGDEVIPASFISLKLRCRNCSNINYNKTYTASSPALQPGEHKTIQVHFGDELEHVLELCRGIPGADVEFHLDLDPEAFSHESRINEQVTIYKACIHLGGVELLLNACTKLY